MHESPWDYSTIAARIRAVTLIRHILLDKTDSPSYYVNRSARCDAWSDRDDAKSSTCDRCKIGASVVPHLDQLAAPALRR
jgi:hypothetical protein